MSEEIHRVGRSLLLTAARIVRLQREALDSLDIRLTFRQYRTLTRVNQGHTKLTELAAVTNRALATMSKNVEGLVKRGLIVRIPDSSDRRTTVLELTDEGQLALKAAEQAIDRVVDTLMGTVEPDEVGRLDDILDRLHQTATAELDW